MNANEMHAADVGLATDLMRLFYVSATARGPESRDIGLVVFDAAVTEISQRPEAAARMLWTLVVTNVGLACAQAPLRGVSVETILKQMVEAAEEADEDAAREETSQWN